jgi:uncharacterized protein (TIGR02145 family)
MTGSKFGYSAALIGSMAMAALGLMLVSCAGSEAIKSAPSVDAVNGLNNKLTWLKSNAQSGGEYVIELDANDRVSCALFSKGNLSYKDRSNITITIRGVGANRVIFPEIPGDKLFKVGSGVTLILDNNITLQGLKYVDGPFSNYDELVDVSSGGTLVMNDGSAITGNTNNSGSGGGVHISAGGAFIMNGGTISGNKSIPGYKKINASVNGQAAGKAAAGAILGAASNKLPKNTMLSKGLGQASDNIAKSEFKPRCPAYHGGGVYVSGAFSLLGKGSPAGTFVKNGGTVTGYDSDNENGNSVYDCEVEILSHNEQGHGGQFQTQYNLSESGGHAIYFDGKEPKAVNTTVGPDDCFEFRNGVYTETRCAAPKPAETVAESEPVAVEARPVAFAEPVREVAPAPSAPPEHTASGGLPRIAAYVFGADDPALNKAMTTRLMAALSNSGRYKPSDNYKDFFTAVNDRKDGAAYISAEQLNSLATHFGAEYVCVAEISLAFGEYQAIAHILDVKAARVVAAGAGDIPLRALGDLAAAADQIVDAMFKSGKRVALSGIAPVVSASSRIIYADGSFTDSRDGRTYRTIKVGGDKAWIAENMNYQTQSGSWCYDDGESNCDQYGRLYDWEAARTACPDGWRLPNNLEWETLAAAAGGQSAAAVKLKAKNGWGDGGNGTNDYGFAALPGGRRRHNDGVFENIGTDGHWWTATPSGANFAYTRNISHRLNNVYVNYYDHKNAGFSVRCVQE